MKGIKHISIFIVLFLIFFVISCKKTQKNWESRSLNIANFLNEFPKEKKIDGEVFIFDSINLIKPFAICRLKNLLLIENSETINSELISCFDINNRRYLYSFLDKGKGPNEYLGVRLNNYSDDTIMALNVFQDEALLFSFKTISNSLQLPDRKITFQKQEKGDHIDQCCLFENELICSGQFKTGSLHLFSMNGKFISYINNYPQVISKEKFDNYHLGYAYGANTFCSFNSAISKFACVNKSSASIFNYSKTGPLVDQVFNIQWSTSNFLKAFYKDDGKPTVIRSAKDELVGAGRVICSNKYLFIPFSDYNVGEIMKNGIEDYYKYILVIDWNGNPIVNLKLSKHIKFSICFDNEERYIYAIHTNNENGFSEIIKFDISFLK